jgi:hypothetical protein
MTLVTTTADKACFHPISSLRIAWSGLKQGEELIKFEVGKASRIRDY